MFHAFKDVGKLKVLAGVLLVSLLVLAMMAPLSFNHVQASDTVIRTPADVYSGQAVLVFVKLSNTSVRAVLRAEVVLNVDLKPAVVALPSLSALKSDIPLLPISWAPGWFIAVIPGLPAKTISFKYSPPIGPPVDVMFKVSSSVRYKLIVDGRVIFEDSYKVLEGDVAKLPPLVSATVYGAERDVLLMWETFGLGPRGWTQARGEPLKIRLLALDDKGISKVTFEYRVGNGSWIEGSVNVDVAVMQSVARLVEDVNKQIESIESAIRRVKPDFELGEVYIPMFAGYAEIPGQNAGTYVTFRARAWDVDENNSTSPFGFYYVVKRESPTKIFIIDPHVKLWLLSENFKLLSNSLAEKVNYDVPREVIENLTLIVKISEAINKYGISPFHHWELLGKHYDLYIAWPDIWTGILLNNLKPHVIILSNLMVGLKLDETTGIWSWDLRDLGVLNYIIWYVKERHAGLIVTHGTLSDWIVWASCGDRYKVGSRGHVGDSTLDFNIIIEPTVAALLGMPELAIWELIRDTTAETLCEYYPSLGQLVGSTPLQVPYVPFNGTLKVTREARYVGWNIPEKFNIRIPSVYEEFNVPAYTQVGWQLAMPRALAYSSWESAYKVRPLAEKLYWRVSRFINNMTQGAYLPEDAVLHARTSLEWLLNSLYGSLVSANFSDTTFNIKVRVPGVNESLTLTLNVEEVLDQILQLVPVKLVAISDDGLAGIVVHDKYWDVKGYRSVYFSFEVEAVEGDIAEILLLNAVEWVLKWEYKDITRLLGGLVRVPKELAEEFNKTLLKLPGNLVASRPLILNEDGYAILKLSVDSPGALYALIAHPTSGEVHIKLLEGSANVTVMRAADMLTLAVLEFREPGKITLAFRAGSELVLNPAYISVKYEAKVEAPPPAQALFEVSNLTINPVEAASGEEVTISVIVRNVGNVEGEYTVVLRINGTVEASKSVKLAGGESTVVTFSIVKREPGIYKVEVNGLIGYFKVKAPPRPAEFIVTLKSISPSEVKVGEEVTITVNVTNVGGITGTHTVVLKVNGNIKALREVTLAPGESTLITFKIIGDIEGTHHVEVNGQKGTFTVKKEAPPTPPETTTKPTIEEAKPTPPETASPTPPIASETITPTKETTPASPTEAAPIETRLPYIIAVIIFIAVLAILTLLIKKRAR